MPHQWGTPGYGPDPRAALLRRAWEHLALAAVEAGKAASGAEPTQEVLDGFPVPRLVDESRTAQLVVLGNRGLGGVAGLVVGSVAFGLGASGACPVVIVRGRSDAADGPVVVGVDGTPISEPALTFAFEAAAARHTGLVADHT